MNTIAITNVAKQADKVAVARDQKRKGKVARVQATVVADMAQAKELASEALAVWAKVKRAEGSLFNRHIELGSILSKVRAQFADDNEFGKQVKDLGLDVIDSSTRSRCIFVADNMDLITDLQSEGHLPKSKSVEVLYRKLKAFQKDAKAPEAKPEAPEAKAEAPEAKAEAEPTTAPEVKAPTKVTNKMVADMILTLLKQNPDLDWEAIAELVDKA